ncbi:MAG: hypothetical protein AB8U44_02675 [Aaplasma endosymbiont of Hyalomma asiaticum]
MLFGRVSSESCPLLSSRNIPREGNDRSSAIAARDRGFSYIRFEFLPSYRLEVFNLQEREVELRTGRDELYIRGGRVPREFYRMSILFEGERWGRPFDRIAGNSFLLGITGLSKLDCLHLLESTPCTVKSVCLDESGCLSLTLKFNSIYRIFEVITSPPSLRNGDCARFIDKYFEWIASKASSKKDVISVLQDGVRRSPEALFRLRSFSQGAKVVLDVQLHIGALRRLLDSYRNDLSIPRTKYKEILEEIVKEEKKHSILVRHGTIPTVAWELATLCLITCTHVDVFDTEELKRWLIFEVSENCDSEIGAHILVLTALHSEFRKLYVARALRSVARLNAMCDEVIDLYVLCKQYVEEYEVENIVRSRGLEMCADAIALPYFVDTPAYVGLCRQVPFFRELRDNALNEGILWVGERHRPFCTLRKCSFKSDTVWVFWRFMSSCWSTADFDPFLLNDAQSLIEYSVDFAYRTFSPSRWIRGSSDVISPRSSTIYEEEKKVNLLSRGDRASFVSIATSCNLDSTSLDGISVAPAIVEDPRGMLYPQR